MDKRVADFSEKFMLANNARSRYETRNGDPYEPDYSWERCWKNYMNLPDENSTRWKANLFVPKSFETVETWLSQMFINPPNLDVIPRNESGTEQANAVSQLLRYYFSMGDTYLKFPDLLRMAGIYGTAIVKVYWNYKSREIKRRAIVADTTDPYRQVVTEVGTQTRIVKDYPTFDIIELQNFWIDPTATMIDEASFVIARRFISKEGLKELLKQPGYSLPDGETEPPSSNRTVDNNFRTDEIGDAFESTDLGSYELFEMWEPEGKLSVFLGQTTCIYSGDGPFEHKEYPFLAFRVNRPPKAFYGRGLLQPIMSLQDEMNAMRSQRRDNVNLVTNVCGTVKLGSPIDKEGMIFEPGRLFPVNEHDDFRPLVLPDITQLTVQEEVMIDRDIKNCIGISEYTAGQNSPGMNKTATGVVGLINQSMARIQKDLRIFELEIIRPLARMFFDLAVQYFDEDKVIAILDDVGKANWIKVSPQDLYGEYDFEPQAGSTAPVNRELKKQQYMTLLQLLSSPNIGQSLMQNAVQINFPKFIELLADAFEIRNKSELIIPLSPIQQQTLVNTMSGDPTGQMQGMAEQAMAMQGQNQGGQNEPME